MSDDFAKDALPREIDEALDKVAALIKAHPKEAHGDLCIAAFQKLQTDTRPAPQPGLWDRPAPPSSRRLSTPTPCDTGEELLLQDDDQLMDFAGVVTLMIQDYPEEIQKEICGDFCTELRMSILWSR